ncbi:cytochrome o ubiquinol oxidase subunit IV [Paenibacillus radicis (ex Gao et al. 2016)]|uniref:Cytochrome o ubiquinol oxidase subunit IV n=1 Tax=Paenibacillus radicis (ex Gao et al. 2016) TaxID=1737354 RepID=A0A917GWP7_9BACL|nr:cytochrome o ubiquinol oxidase subunit IV [Paenibacillus radicis (ex Gao et al. 2016)]GGG59631.1 cytochrome o ubiquinol oxidase subunit IV [Paenibacillus radicis (ex Gao et al. 2016)]
MAASSKANHPAEDTHGSLRSYTIGFVFSIVLTVIPIAIVRSDWLEGTANAVVLMGAAVLQLIVQLLFFMHLREEKNPRYNLLSLIFGLVILLVVVAGSMWIMMFNQVAG